MKPIFRLSLFLVFVFGCAKIPVQSIALAEALQTEGERMHKLNLVFLNRIFTAKRDAVQQFINNEYAPKAISNFVAKVEKVAPSTDFKKEFPELMQAIAPEINARRDSLANVLEAQKEKIVDKLNADFAVFNIAAVELKKLLESAVKVDREKQSLFNQARTLSNNRINFNQLEEELDKFIRSSGNVGSRVAAFENTINLLLNDK